MQEKIALEQVQEIEFGVLKYIKEVCEVNGIQYYLAYGTLIGAARHRGFIPWDDDIDIMMPREDYHKLLLILEKKPHPFYKIISVDTDKRFQVPLAKMVDSRTILKQNYDLIEPVPLGVYVDIFLLDGAGDDYNLALKHYDQAFKLYRYWKKSRLKIFPSSMSKIKGLLRWIKNFPFIVRGSRYFMKQLTRHNTTFSYDESKYLATFETGSSDARKCIWEYSVFEPGTFLEFNDVYFQVPKDYDTVLKSEYGDYMVLPPEEKRVSHHSYDLKWRDDL